MEGDQPQRSPCKDGATRETCRRYAAGLEDGRGGHSEKCGQCSSRSWKKAWQRIPPVLPKGNAALPAPGLGPHEPDFGLPASGILREGTSAVLNHRVGGNSLQQPQEANESCSPCTWLSAKAISSLTRHRLVLCYITVQIEGL